MFDIYVTYSPDQIRNAIGWADKVSTNDLVQAIMVLCNSVERLEREIERLDDVAYAPSVLTPVPADSPSSAAASDMAQPASG